MRERERGKREKREKRERERERERESDRSIGYNQKWLRLDDAKHLNLCGQKPNQFLEYSKRT